MREEAKVVPFEYREFYDLPRLIVLKLRGETYLLQSGFDDERDEYSDEYEVYLLPNEVRAGEDWGELLKAVAGKIGSVKIQDVRFDYSKRRTLSSSKLEELVAAHTKSRSLDYAAKRGSARDDNN